MRELNVAGTSDVADALLDYLQKHPDNADTREGIARWWILRQHLEIRVEMVEAALEELVEKGKVERFGSTAGMVYRLRRPEDDGGDG